MGGRLFRFRFAVNNQLVRFRRRSISPIEFSFSVQALLHKRERF
jgi:hypothetical protein